MNNIIEFYKNYENGIENYMHIAQKRGNARVYALSAALSAIPANIKLSKGTTVYNGFTDAFAAKNEKTPCIICVPVAAKDVMIVKNNLELAAAIEISLIEEYNYYININGKSISATMYLPKLSAEQSEREDAAININKWLFRMYIENKIVDIEPYKSIAIYGNQNAKYKYVTRYIRKDDGSYAPNTAKQAIIIKIIKK
jgi:hypothetical protein